MGKTQRIKTEVGINKQINVEFEQDFDFLEILSLKIQQEDVYTKSCSEYGVVVGRVTANNGFGVPNARVSIFIPVTNQDKSNPEIYAIYPYTSPDEKNEDGYRYNLLPYEKTHSNHVPTGTFPSRVDALTDRVAIDIYNKYYKYTVKTNDSGDFMIMGVPLGVQTVFMDLDLSDMGEFSLTPQDVVRMGRATEAQISGAQFKSSTDLNSLPQIVSITKSIDVAPFWGDPEICQIAISRCDFDLRDDAKIDIQPTAIFMGSLVSSVETKSLKTKCKPPKELGNMCNLVAGPGQILSIRQTINVDEFGRPILEQYNFDGGNDVIDGDGAWLVDLPMNLDYYVTNEFGEKTLSDDPSKGIPTKAKYRFKIKWKQSEDLGQRTKRAYYLVPNIREYGWSGGQDPKDTTGASYDSFVRSYAFSLDWSDYGFTGSTAGNAMINEAINCEDRFYEFNYNQVYTVSSFVDLYHRGTNRGRFIGIKNITDETCESENYKFPTNDGIRGFDFIFSVFNFFIQIFVFILLPLIIVLHILAFIWPLFKLLFTFVYTVLAWTVYGLCKFVDLIPFVNPDCQKPLNPKEIFDKIGDPFKKIPMTSITYPDCETCKCKAEDLEVNQGETYSSTKEANENQSLSCNIDSQSPAGFSNIQEEQYCVDDPLIGGQNAQGCRNLFDPAQNCDGQTLVIYGAVMAGSTDRRHWKRTPAYVPLNCGGTVFPTFSQDLTLSERLNLFNLKGKYFNDLSSQGGGWNQIKVTVRPDLNSGKFHYDNVMAVLIDDACVESFTTGKIISFNDKSITKDPNITFGPKRNFLNRGGEVETTSSVTGTPTNLSQVTYTYADQTNSNNLIPISVSYQVDQSSIVDFSTTQVIQQSTGELGDGVSQNFSIYTDRLILESTITIQTLTDLGSENFTDNGLGTLTSNLGGKGTVDYTTGFFDLLFSGIPNDNQAITASYTYFTTGDSGTNKYIIQKFPTDVEFYQVITAVTYGDFVKMNPPIPTGDYGDPTGKPNYNSLCYRYTDNFLIPWSMTVVNSFPYFGQYAGTRYATRPIYAIPEQKNLRVVFMMKGVDPHSARQNTEIDLSRLFGKSYNSVVIQGQYKLNVPIKPGLVLPRHDTITNTSQGQIFFQSLAYQTSSDFSGYTTNLTENYSSLDKSNLSFVPDSSLGQPYSLGNASNTSLPYLAVNNSINRFGTTNYEFAIPSNIFNSTLEPYQNTPTNLTFNNKEHRGYYNKEYIEGGTYFYMYAKPAGIAPDIDFFRYYSPAYGTGTTPTQFNQQAQNIVMRCERLPTSSYRKDVQGNNTFVLHQNRGFAYYFYEDTGVSQGAYPDISSGYISGDNLDDEVSQFEESLISSFTCDNLAPLKCYSGSGFNFGVKPQGDSCYSNPSIIRNGCYIFVDKPIVRLFKDFAQLGEWKTRFTVNLAACRGIFSHTFNNNWVNGTLFAFPIKNNRFFRSPLGAAPNQPFNVYCEDVTMLHPTSNNFYYRSSPYNNKFVGKPISRRNGRNKSQLLYPTTIMNLGPKDDFVYELTLSIDYFGYNMKNITQTTYQDISNILNLYIISRQVSSNFLQQILGAGDASIGVFFSRFRNRIDGDYAQAISINSELGVDEFDFESYGYDTGNTTQNTFYLQDKTVGIFFSSNTQTRDFVTPRRIIRDDFNPPYKYDNLNFFSQEVPFYKWSITQKNNNIFGTEKNDWATSVKDISSYFYQSLDRTKLQYIPPSTQFGYFMGETNINLFYKGYIYNVKATGGGNFIFEPKISATMVNYQNILVGAPYHFYFGLKRGNSALDKFNKKYLGIETI
jgi:hypothetical protein